MLSIVAKMVSEICFINEKTLLIEVRLNIIKLPEKYIISVASGTTKRLVRSDKIGML